jgi:hypothetical protein
MSEEAQDLLPLHKEERIVWQRDEWLETQEAELARARTEVGRHLARLHLRLRRLSRGPARHLPLPARSRLIREIAAREMEFYTILGKIAELREVRRGLLGKSAKAHIRSRSAPSWIGNVLTAEDYGVAGEGDYSGPEGTLF